MKQHHAAAAKPRDSMQLRMYGDSPHLRFGYSAFRRRPTLCGRAKEWARTVRRVRQSALGRDAHAMAASAAEGSKVSTSMPGIRVSLTPARFSTQP